MGINFPNTPSIGTTWPNPPVAGQPVYTWDGEKWGSGSGYGAIYMSDTPPAAPAGSLWYETDTGLLYARVWDGDSLQWVQVLSGPPDAVLFNTVQALSETQKVTARKNVYAAPFDAMAYAGMQINGSMEVSQELGLTPRTTTGHVCDNWIISNSGTTAFSASTVVAGAGYNGIPNVFQAIITTGQASLGANDYVQVYQFIEGYRVARLLYGFGTAQPVTIGFWTGHHRPGTYSISIRNSVFNRSYVTTYTQNVGDTAEYKTVTIPGDASGTWLVNYDTGLIISFALGAGTAYTTAPNVWTAGNFLAATGQINGAAAASDVFRLTGVIVLPGIEAPIAARSAYIMRPYDQELMMCKRYWCKTVTSHTSYQSFAGSSQGGNQVNFPVEMRVVPTLSQGALLTTSTNLTGFNLLFPTTLGFVHSGSSTTSGTMSYSVYVHANARL